ncbi:MAG TPA: hypothetical protein VLW45_06875 [Pelomicrobium sp.]|nr:hypothetical protein [Pelomicrobium sp.]
MSRQHGGHQPDEIHHGGNQPGEDEPHEKPERPPADERPDVDEPGANAPSGRKPKPGPDPDKPGGRY